VWCGSTKTTPEFFRITKSPDVVGALLLSDCLISGIRHEGHEAGEFDGVGNHALVFGAEFVASRSADFKLGGYIRTQKFGVLVIDVADVVFT